MISIDESYVVGSEAILSLYPILIKAIPTSLPTQIFSRLITFTAAGSVFSSKNDFKLAFGTREAFLKTIALGLLTCLHIYASYVAFSSLSAGVAMSLFYTYPIWNLVIEKLVFNKTIHASTYSYMLWGVLGTFLLTTKGVTDEIKGITKNNYGALIGVVAALGAAITESAMYFAVKINNQDTPWSSMLELYGGALICMLVPVLLRMIKIEFSWAIWVPIVIFNLLVGFAGYALRAYTIPKVSTEVFGLLSYTGVISAFVAGFIFMKEKPSLLSVFGALLIAYAASHIEQVKGEEEKKAV